MLYLKGSSGYTASITGLKKITTACTSVTEHVQILSSETEHT